MDEILFVSSKRYIHFDSNGEIISVGNLHDSESNYLEVELSDVINLIDGTEHMHNYYVVFDTVEKKYVLKHKINSEEYIFNVNDYIYHIPKNINFRTDLTIKHDITNNCFVFSLDSAIQEYLEKKVISYTHPLTFSITKNNDPHILIRFLKVNLNQLINNDLVIPFESNDENLYNDISIFTTKRLDSYKFISD